MASIAGICLQEVELRRKVGSSSSDGYEEASYAQPETILVRLPEDLGLSRTATGQEVSAESEGLTEADVAVGDLMGSPGREVRRVSEIRERSGRLIGRRFYL